jgi:uncharacterized protein involved in response to NO
VVAAAGGWPAPPEDFERHALGAGYVLLLVVGMGLRLLPGFAGPPRRRVALPAAWLAIWAAHLAALLRVGPPLAFWLASVAAPDATRGLAAGTTRSQAASGLLGAVAIVGLAAALRVPLTPPAPPERPPA